MGDGVSLIVLDTHVVQWWSAEPQRLSKPAVTAIESADELAVAAISWYELAWLASHGRIVVSIPIRAWLAGLALRVRTLPITASLADAAVALPESFPGDPADRLIFATAVEHGAGLVTKDGRMRKHRHPHPITVW